MLVLFETPAGYAIFKVLDEGKLQRSDDLYKDFETPEAASKVVKLKHFSKFVDMTEALSAATAAVEGKMGKGLKKVLKKVFSSDAQEQLAVADAKLGGVIKEKLNIPCVHNSAVSELFRGIRAQMANLITGLPQSELDSMALGLSHSLSRYKLKFSPDKVDTMIVQAIALLDDLDKELNNYSMRSREWYGWHFPEMGKIVTDNLTYARTVKEIGIRSSIESCDLSDILPEEVEEEVRSSAEVSMGTEISDDDRINILHLCDQVIEISDYRAQLYDYLRNRMMAIAPNLTLMVGELVGARLIAHAGSLLNLAKHPSSTVQILGAEKALFRALKTKHDTPKYGLIYHASLVGQSAPKNKGKISRMLAAKASLCVRVDALGEETTPTIGLDSRIKVEQRLKKCEENKLHRISGSGRAGAKPDKYELKSTPKQYNAASDFTLDSSRKRKREDSPDNQENGDDPGEPTKKIKKQKKRLSEVKVEGEEEEQPAKKVKKEKKRLSEVKVEGQEEEQPEEESSPSKKMKKKKKRMSEVAEMEVEGQDEEKTKKKKKAKRVKTEE